MTPQGALIGAAEAPLLHVMSWNIRRAVPSFLTPVRDRWLRRRTDLHALLRREAPTVLAVQEAMPAQASWLRAELGQSYRSIGHGRNADGSGEGCPIFYDVDRLTLDTWEQRALSSRPDRAGSRSWGTIFPRTAVVALFTDRQSGERLRVINTHLDPILEHSRARSAEYLAQVIAETTHPTVLCGDLNASPQSRPLQILAAAGLQDAWQSAANRLTAEWGTFGGYRPPKANGKRIDWILTSTTVDVSDVAINPHRGAQGWGSDHLPVQVTLRVNKEQQQ